MKSLLIPSRHHLISILLGLTSTSTTIITTTYAISTTSSSSDFNMVTKIQHLRGEDKRLIIDEPTPEMIQIRDDEFSPCSDNALPRILTYLTDDDESDDDEKKDSIYKKGQAAAILSLCTHNHPTNRAKIGTSKGVPEALVSLVREAKERWIKGEEVATTFQYLDVAALAAEAIWTLVFNDAEVHGLFVEAGAVEELGGFILASSSSKRGDNDGEGGGGACIFPNHEGGDLLGRSPCHFVRMWAAAALENLASDYCDNGDGCKDEFCGVCFYEWDDDETSLILEPHEEGKEVKKIVSATATRKAIADMDGLIEELLRIVCEVDPERKHEREHPYPTESQVGRDDGMPSTVRWAAAGVLKNLALEDDLRPIIASDEAYKCLCDMSGSYDWLEADKAEDAIYLSGRQDDCDEFMEEKFHGGGGGDDDGYYGNEYYDDDDDDDDDDYDDDDDDDEEGEDSHGGEL